jgi:hypothetical protein
MKTRWVRWFQFRLRTLLLSVAAIAWPLSILGNALQEYRTELAVLRELPRDVRVFRLHVQGNLTILG